jgi:hypothetical protein
MILKRWKGKTFMRSSSLVTFKLYCIFIHLLFRGDIFTLWSVWTIAGCEDEENKNIEETFRLAERYIRFHENDFILHLQKSSHAIQTTQKCKGRAIMLQINK